MESAANLNRIAISADNFTIYIALAFACVACIAYLIAGLMKRDDSNAWMAKLGRAAYYVSFAGIAYTSIYLLQGILSGSRYDIAYIFDNSSLRDRILYRVSSFWAGQGGSLLLWALLGGIVGILLPRKMERIAPLMLSFWCSVQAFFLVLLVVDDPMKRVANYQPGMIGSGLNPLLKNPWMAIHPPVIFLGYALLVVPAAFAIQALIEGDGSRWVRRCLPWALSGWVALTAGLVLGMVWSYEVLGWGGYWGWDPVENASLVPWLVSTALVHGLVLQRYRGRMARSNMILAFGSFLTVLYATFLTRSGVLSEVSVHSFGKSPAEKWLIAFPIFFAVLCIGTLIVRWKAVSQSTKPLRPDSKDGGLVAGVVVLILFALVVLLGTSYTTFGKKSVLDPGFYTHMSIPLAIAAAVLIALTPLLKWGGEDGKRSDLKSLPAAFGIVVLVSLIGAGISIGAPNLNHALFGWFLPEGSTTSRIAVQILLLLLGTSIIALIVSAAKASKSSLMYSGAYLSHAGVALMILGIVFSTSGRSKLLDLSERGAPAKAYGYTFAYEGRRQVSENKEVVKIKATRGERTLDVPLVFVRSDRGNTSFPYIHSGILGDLYISPQEITSKTITPTASMAEGGWTTTPIAIPGSDATLTLVGMQVEAHAAKLRYSAPGVEPKEFTVAEGSPANVDGYIITFKGFVSNGANNMMSMTAGVDLGISGRGFVESAVIRVSRKPMMSLLWLGTILIMVGGCIAILRRRSGKPE